MTGRNIKVTKLDQFLAEIRQAQSKKQYLDIFQKFKFKLDQEIPSDISSDYNQTLLHCAAVVDNVELAKALIEAGANIDAPDHQECTPIYRAVSNSSINVLKILLKSGASTMPYPSIVSPLHIAVRRGFLPVAKLLISAKADVRARDENGIEPIHYIGAGALFNIHEGLCAMAAVDALTPDAFENDAEPEPEFKNLDLQCLKLLLNNGADVNATDSFGNNVLQLNATTRSSQLIKYLIKSGAQVNHTNHNGQTALHILLRGLFCTATISSLKTLLKCGANPNLKDKEGKTPFDALDKNHHFPDPWKKKIIKIINSFEHPKD